MHPPEGGRCPDFLLIGAMKAGTTTLYRDLLLNPLIYFPVDKEPGHLSTDVVLTPRGLGEYSRLYADAARDALCGDGSTIYSKRPDVRDVPERAQQVLENEFRVIYLVRDPVERAISHYRHLVVRRGLALSIRDAVDSLPELVNYGRYAYQLEPWLKALGRDRVCVVAFEEYVANRAATVTQISQFLGLEARTERIQPDRIYYATDGARVPTGAWQKLRQSPLYRRYIRPLVSVEQRERIRRRLLSEAKAPTADVPLQMRASLEARLRDDAMELTTVLGWNSPPWPWVTGGALGP